MLSSGSVVVVEGREVTPWGRWELSEGALRDRGGGAARHATLLQRGVGDGGAADCRHPAGHLQLTQAPPLLGLD